MKLDITKKVYIIAEIGHNHQGNLETAFELLDKQSLQVLMLLTQKRDNKSLYTKSFFNEKYDHENSYGKTYGEHREYLEFGISEYKELINYAKEIEIDFFQRL